MSDWIEEIRWIIRLSSAGKLVLVDHAIPEKLGPLVRALLADHPDLDVLTNVLDLPQLANGAVLVLVPRATDADWLNINRPLFARKALKVVLFCSREISEALARDAPDFFDWISLRQECPEGVAEHAVLGIRAALRARAPGITFVLEGSHKNWIEHAERIFQEALPGRRLLWLTPWKTPYDQLVRQIREAGPAWVACHGLRYPDTERFRWALAEAGRCTRALLLQGHMFEDRFWGVSDALWPFTPAWADARTLLARAGAKHPGRLAAVAGLEPATISALIELLARGYAEETLLFAMLRSPDPGAGLAERILSAGVDENPLQGRLMRPPVQRYLGKRVGLRRKFPGRAARKVEGFTPNYCSTLSDDVRGSLHPLLLGRASRIEWLLCQGGRTPERWIELARLALDHGDPDAAVTWADRALSMRESSEAHLLHGIARASLGHVHFRMGDPAGLGLLRDALRSLQHAEETLDPRTPREDELTLYALRTDLLLILGLDSEVEQPLRKALQWVDEPNARVQDLQSVALALMRRGQIGRAEQILNYALAKTQDAVERARIRLNQGWVALARGFHEEGDSIAEAVLDDKDPRVTAPDGEIRAGADSIRVRARLARNETQEALTLADAMLAAAPPWGTFDRSELSRLLLLVVSLNRAGRTRDAELIIRKLLALPLDADFSVTALGLLSRDKVLAFLASPTLPGITPPARRVLWNELVLALRSQGRHIEAGEMERLGDEQEAPRYTSAVSRL